MKCKIITYLYRKKTQDTHSIEGVFENVALGISKVSDLYTSQSVSVPYAGASPRALLSNSLFSQKVQSDIVHITGDIHYVALALDPQSTVITVHDCGVTHYDDMNPVKKRLIKYLWFTLPLNRARWITAISVKTKQEIVERIGIEPEKITVIPNSYHPSFEFAAYPNSDRLPVILQIGTGPNKNLQRVINALVGVRCVLSIIGRVDEQLREYLEQQDISYRVAYDVSLAEVYEKYHECHVVSFASTYEGFGMPIIEAQAMGRPVVTSNIEPMKSVAGDAACLVDPYDTRSIRDGFLRILRNKDFRCQLIDAGLRNASKYSIENIARKYSSLYERVLGES